MTVLTVSGGPQLWLGLCNNRNHFLELFMSVRRSHEILSSRGVATSRIFYNLGMCCWVASVGSSVCQFCHPCKTMLHNIQYNKVKFGYLLSSVHKVNNVVTNGQLGFSKDY